MISCILLISMMLNTAPAGSVTPGPEEAARAAFETGNYSMALTTVTAALSAAPQNPSLHYWALRSYYELRDYDHAVTHGETAVKLDPQNAEYSRWLGRAYGGKAEESRSFFIARKVKQAFEAAVHLAPTSIPARRDLMEFLAEAERSKMEFGFVPGEEIDKVVALITATSAEIAERHARAFGPAHTP